jgi:hypothetical protein
MSAYRTNFFVDKDRNILIFRVIGAMPSAEVVEALFAGYATVEAPWTYNRLMDFRRFEGLVDFADVERISTRWAEMIRECDYQSKVAVVSHDALDKVRVPTASPLFPRETLCHFSDYHEAMAWLANGAIVEQRCA